MMENPFVSIVILNHNKKEKCVRCIESALTQEEVESEIIVVDNASRDGSVQAIHERFADRVQIIERRENSVTQGRNDGFRKSKGKIVLSLDNDVLLPDATFIRKGLSLLERFPDVGLLTPIIGSSDDPARYQKEHWWHPFRMESHHDSFFLTAYFPEAAVLFRKSALDEVGGYDESFFMGFEQVDLAVRMIRAGWKILYCPNLVCIEDDSRSEFVSRRHPIHYYNLRNKLWTAWKHYPFPQAVSFVLTRSLSGVVRGCRYGYPDLILRAILRGILPPRIVRAQRKPMSPGEWRDWIHQKKGELIPSP